MPGPCIHTKQPPGFSTNPGGFVDKIFRLLDFLLRVGGGLSGGVLRGSSQLPQAEHGGAGRGQRVRVVQALHVREGAQQTAGTKVVVLGGGQLLAQGSRTDRQLGAQHVGVLAALQLGQGQLQLLLVQDRVGGHGAGAQHGGQLVAGHAQLGAQLVNFAQVLVQANGRSGGGRNVHNKQNQQHNVHDQHDVERHRAGAAG